ncbi:hypothetical protein [Tenacibaculum maritimum]|uniref:hypothetical protein n=1 Tax=Tenacibaculum maritimum TaxID=107401 RepID=UPI0012E57157|nr:hypothetical protein [Tenacibaculum maritimum]CAA0240685.1 conserved membrane hypothetical protein [Tenacibaculum maritimum]
MKNNIKIAVIYLWIGFVIAISFMEAWIKFRAEGVTLPIGLAIGSLVFWALNKVEIVLAVILVSVFWHAEDVKFNEKHLYRLIVPLVILLVQTLYLLPVLEERAQLIIQSKEVAKCYVSQDC